MAGGLNVDREGVGAGIPKGLDTPLRVLDHEVHVKGQLHIPAAVLDQLGAERYRGYEVPVHHVDVDPVGTRLLERNHLLSEAAEVRRQDRGGDQQAQLTVGTVIVSCESKSW